MIRKEISQQNSGWIKIILTTFGAGTNTVKWNGTDFYGNCVSSGGYFFKLVATSIDGRESQFTRVRKTMLMK